MITLAIIWIVGFVISSIIAGAVGNDSEVSGVALLFCMAIVWPIAWVFWIGMTIGMAIAKR